MKQNFKIDNPCKESWSCMSKTANGAFCETCQIQVLDFTQSGNQFIAAFLKENEDNKICCRIKKSQLTNSTLSLKNKIKKDFLKKSIHYILMLFGISVFSSCSGVIEKGKESSKNPKEDVIIIGTIQKDTTTIQESESRIK